MYSNTYIKARMGKGLLTIQCNLHIQTHFEHMIPVLGYQMSVNR